MFSFSRSLTVGVLAAATLLAPATAHSLPSNDVADARKPLGAGMAQAWVRTGSRNVPVAFGVTFDDASLANLGDREFETALALPAAQGLPFRTVVIDWNPHGHPPAHVYDVPHFDFHFYTIDEAARMNIAPEGAAALATPDPNVVPGGFVTDGSTVPMMGKHYVSRSMPEFNGGRFTATPIYGYYDGHLAFVEAMIARSYLQDGPSLSLPLAQPMLFEHAGLYPTRWSVTHDVARRQITIAFSALAQH